MVESSRPPLKLLICGIPAVAKSTFGRWLQKTHAFSFLELEATPNEEDSLDANGLRQPWERFWRGEDLTTFPEALFAGRSALAVEWGFPVNLLHVVVALQRAGLVPWWFEGDRFVARSYFKLRDRRPIELFDHQVAAICSTWCSIDPVFADRIVRVAKPDGSLETPEAIYAAIVGAA
jgi:hypothetical protein